MFRRSVCVVWLLVAMARGQVTGTTLSADQIAEQLERMNAIRAHINLELPASAPTFSITRVFSARDMPRCGYMQNNKVMRKI